ncbi:hypothetical protein IE077_000013 [Cardiosporidium cionae]|uniref:Uncharacterized protein n=1 Tax=Cardiosporidium cionae TaxID=476202 RepID=A0ABQ7J6M1_9APIC|nr:hypothetical protein IE077_000013 [Cardiosporidium cionae]|eukprot:KAF8819622.1 hypothetical protein IE077_000013 [Cardiosporidium cionae]
MESSSVEQPIYPFSGDSEGMTATNEPCSATPSATNEMEGPSSDFDHKMISTFSTLDENSPNPAVNEENEKKVVTSSLADASPSSIPLLPLETCVDCLRGELQLDSEEFNIVQQALHDHSNEWRFETCTPTILPTSSKKSSTTTRPALLSSKPSDLTSTLSHGRSAPHRGGSAASMTEKTHYVPHVIMHAMKEGSSLRDIPQEISQETQRSYQGIPLVPTSPEISTLPPSEMDGRLPEIGLQTMHSSNMMPPSDSLPPLPPPAIGSTPSAYPMLSKRSPLSSQSQQTLPEWTKCLHGLLVELGQLPLCPQLLFQPINPYDMQQRAASKRLLPSEFVNLEGILRKLEAGTYTHCGEAMNDVCTLFVCAFRYYMPGSVLWMNTHETAHFFLENVRKFPILAEGCRLCGDLSAILNWKRRYDTTCVDETIQMMILKGREKKKKKKMEAAGTTVAPSGGGRGKEARIDPSQGMKKRKPYKPRSRGGKRLEGGKAGPRVRTSPYATEGNLDAPIMDEERGDFQNLLLKLNQDQHFALFSEYQQRAVWRTLDGGEVELDDRGTAPHIFRDMIVWCRRQLAAPIVLQSQKAYFEAMPLSDTMADATYASGTGYPRATKGVEYNPAYESNELSSETSSGSEDSESGSN